MPSIARSVAILRRQSPLRPAGDPFNPSSETISWPGTDTNAGRADSDVCYDADGAPVSCIDGSPVGGFQPYNGSGSGSSTSSGSGSSSGMTPAQQTAAYNLAGQILGTTAGAITGIINSGNQVEIARLQSQAAQQIAALNAQTARLQAAGASAAQLQALQAQIAALQAVQTQAAAHNPNANLPLYIALGIGGLAVVGGIVYFASRPRRNPAGAPRANPVVVRHGRKKFVRADKVRGRRRGKARRGGRR